MSFIDSSAIDKRSIHKISIYSNRDGYILIGYDKKKTIYRMLRVIKHNVNGPNDHVNLKSQIKEDSKVRSKEDIAKFLRQKGQEFRFACKAYAIMGFIRFLQGYYMLAVTEAECVSKINSHKIYKVNFVSYIPLFDQSPSNEVNEREKTYMKDFKKNFDLGTGFYFSDGYDLTNTFQTNNIFNLNEIDSLDSNNQVYKQSKSAQIRTFNEMFLWNYYLISDFHECLKFKKWVKGFMFGYVEQIKVKKILRSYQIVLIARRSRHHAGTRYLTRGINQNGFVANYVEVEQIVLDLTDGGLQNPYSNSFVQLRGSVPAYWFQETRVYEPKPPIQMNSSADILFDATKKHFADLYSLYGPQILIINLVKKKEKNKREEHLTEAYQQALEYLNRDIPEDLKITYYHQDMKALLKRDREEFLNLTNGFASKAINDLGYFCVKYDKKTKSKQILSFQTGIIRSNCVDCLDRTNTFQQLVGEAALALQISKLQENESNTQSEYVLEDALLKHFRHMYGRMGDEISLQYGGSQAHKPNIGAEKKKFELLTSFKRYWTNTFIDQDRQNAMNLFLGVFQPFVSESPIWETSSQIKLSPNFDLLNELLEEKNWWSKPLEHFRERTFFQKIGLIRNASSPSFIDVNARADSLFEGFPSLRTKEQIILTRKNSQEQEPEEEITIDIQEDGDDQGALSTKLLAYHKDKVDGRNYSDSVDFFDTSPKHSSGNLNTSKDAIPEYRFVDEMKLSNFESKLKKRYNAILNLDEKDEDEDDIRNNKKMRDRMNRRKKSIDDSDPVLKYAFLDNEEAELYANYCNMYNLDADNMFTPEETNQISRDIQNKLDSLNGLIDDDGRDLINNTENQEIEKFPERPLDYLKEEYLRHIRDEPTKLFNDLKDTRLDFARQESKYDLQNSKTLENKFNIPSLKNMFTTVFPNLQKPNIMKV